MIFLSFHSLKNCVIFHSGITDKVDKVDRVNEVDRVDKVEEVDKVDKVDKVDNVDEVDKVYKVDNVNRVDKVDKIDKVNEIDKVDKVDNVAATLKQVWSPEMEFKEFESRFKSAKPRFKFSAGLNFETFDTILSRTNHI